MRYGLILLLFHLLCTCVRAQDTPREVLLRLFDGMRSGDSTGMAALFHPRASLNSLGEDGGLQQGSIESWLTALNQTAPGTLDEQLHYTEIRTDGGLATAWTPYTFVLNGEVHHCGTNAFQLMQTTRGTWQLLNIADTRRTTGCTLPDTTSVEQELRDLADGWHAAAARADATTYFGMLSDSAVYIGTDPAEHWTKAEFEAFARPYFAAGEAWDFTARERHVFYDPYATTAYWDELLDTWMGPCRGTGIAERNAAGEWKIVHYTLSVAVPNERMEGYRALIGKE
ncbi:nuclear transport factor 2 family protein [Neolewinella sp.]|uniref:nuclear transport factor 2 family protein n=1 Tax=Neolewinella sp. TaxID=2993543 RepID=UPI003B528842